MTNDDSDALRKRWRAGPLPRLIGEFLVIVLGVLIALAADRWNQERSETVTAEDYLVRVSEEIRSDSVTIERWFAASDRGRAAGDSLKAAMLGTLELDGVRRPVLTAGPALRFPPIVAWEELNNTGALRYIRDADLRRALSTYYASRVEAEQVLSSIEERSRSPYFDVLYPLGLMDGTIEPAEFDAFLEVPGGIGLLNGLGGYLFSADNRAKRVLEAAVRALSALEAALARGSA